MEIRSHRQRMDLVSAHTVPASCQTLICLPGMYGTLGTPAPGNTPGGRASPVTWTDQEGALWLFGGTGVDANGEGGTLNDVWNFDPAAGEWTWMGGSNSLGSAGTIPGMYGTLGIAAAGNSPGGRTEATGWTDANGNFWLFGGSGSDAHEMIGHLNDLWVYMPVTPAPTLDPAPGNYTTVQKVTIADSTPGAFLYYTTDGTNPTTASSKYSGPITVSSTKTIMAIAAASGYSNSAVTSGTIPSSRPLLRRPFLPRVEPTPRRRWWRSVTPRRERRSTTQRTAPTPLPRPRNTAGRSPFPRRKPSRPLLRPVVLATVLWLPVYIPFSRPLLRRPFLLLVELTPRRKW